MKIVAVAAVAWVGFFVHNLADLPGQTLRSPETLYPTLVTVAFVVAWLIRPGRVTAGLLFGWALLHLVGAMLTVLPLPFLPFAPEQSLKHYAYHVLYALTQLPLIVLTARQLRTKAPDAAAHAR